jgi:ABC-type nitrate/sulfonate/bicarbonate transport system substrate-binding protein
MLSDSRKKRSARLVGVAVLSTVAALGLAACSSSSSGTAANSSATGNSAKLFNIDVNTASASAEWADIYVAQDEGFFAKNGLQITTVLSKNEPGTALVDGEAQISTGTPTTLYIDDSAGADLKAIYSQGSTYEAWVAKPGITSPAGLAGKTLGVFSLQDIDVIYTHEMMSQFGVPASDYKLLAVGESTDKLAAVRAGSIATAPLYPPTNFQAAQAGLHQIFSTSQLKEGQLPSFYIITAAYGAAHRAQVIDFLKSLNEAHNFLFDPSNKAKVISIIESHTGLSAELAEQSYNIFFTQPGLNYSKAGEWSASPTSTLGPTLIGLGLYKKPVAYSTLYDLSYLQAADAGS